MEPSFSCAAWCKMILHCLKYPHDSVLGLLVGKKDNNRLNVVDSIPVAHINPTLIPAIEMACIQVDAYCKVNGLHIVGVYHANSAINDNSRDLLIGRMLEKIENDFSDAIAVTIDNANIASMDSSQVKLGRFCADSKSIKEYTTSKSIIDGEEETMSILSECIQCKSYRQIIDYDNHLDQPNLDFFNQHINNIIAQ